MGDIIVPVDEFKKHHTNCEQLRNIFLNPIFNDDKITYAPKEITNKDLELAYPYLIMICDFVVEYDVEQTKENKNIDNITKLTEAIVARTEQKAHSNFSSLVRLLQQYYKKYDFIIEYDGKRLSMDKNMTFAFDTDMKLLYYYADDNLENTPLGAITISSITCIKRGS